MAELRTILKTEIRDFVGIRYLLALGDQYSVIPNPLQALGYTRNDSDYHILVLGPTGLHLMSYHLVLYQESSQHFLTIAQQLERSAALLYDYLTRFGGYVPAFHLYIVVPDGNIEGEATPYVQFVPWGKVRGRVEDAPQQLEGPQITKLLDTLKAEVHFQRIDRYHILCELERSPESSKYLAMNTIDDRAVTLKEVRLPYDPDQIARNAIIRGAKMALNLSHENIINVEKLIPKEDRFYIVSEWCEGGITLKEYMLDHPGMIPLTTAIQLIKDLCQALMYAHDQGVIHRNLTPENMLVTAEHRLKVLNFDVAKKADMHTLQSTDFKKLTQENPYSAPEYMIGTHQVDQRVDVYSVGVIFYELLTGRKPSHYDEAMWEPPSRVIPGLPHYMDSLVARAIRFDKDQRFSTIHAFYSALEKGVSDLVGSRYRVVQQAQKSASKNSLLYKAQDQQTDQVVALKKLLILPTTSHATRLQVLRQSLEPLQALRNLHHPGLIALIDTLIEDDDGFVVMNWIEGRDLRETLQKRASGQGLLPEEVRQIGLQLSSVLDYLHQQGFVHGDIKPENVMLSEGWKITLLDFFPWRKDEAGSLQRVPKTIRYMAPELIAGSQTPDEQTDIFAFGVLLYELLTHKFPYDIAQLRSIASAKPGTGPLYCRPEPFAEDIPEALQQVVLRALSCERHERYQLFSQIRADLEQDLISDALFTPAQPAPAEGAAPRVPQALWLWAIAGSVLLCLFVLQSVQKLVTPLPTIQEVFYE